MTQRCCGRIKWHKSESPQARIRATLEERRIKVQLALHCDEDHMHEIKISSDQMHESRI